MGFKKGILEAIGGILLGIILPVLINLFLKNYPNAATILALIDLLALLGLIKNLETIKEIPITTAAGYFLTVFTIGSVLLPDWEVGFHIILLIVYIFSKIK